MLKKPLMIAAVLLAGFSVAGFATTYFGQKEPVVFYKGHTHHDGGTQGAPAHSGGTNAMGCHNASVPYHCH